jgi:hypothetical protein
MANQESKKEVVIYCEGKTERDYLKQFINKYFSRIASRIMVKDCEHNHSKPLVEHVLRRRKINPNKQTQYWCVFDRDDNSEQDLQFCRGKEGQIRLFYSNPCVEFWFFLHGSYRDEEIGCQKKDMIPALKKVKGFEGYAKPGFDYEPLWNEATFNQAKNNAKKRLSRYLKENDTSIFISRKSDPITTIHHLIEALETLDQQSKQETTTL